MVLKDQINYSLPTQTLWTKIPSSLRFPSVLVERASIFVRVTSFSSKNQMFNFSAQGCGATQAIYFSVILVIKQGHAVVLLTHIQLKPNNQGTYFQVTNIHQCEEWIKPQSEADSVNGIRTRRANTAGTVTTFICKLENTGLSFTFTPKFHIETPALI